MSKIRYAVIGFGGIAENRIAKEGFACDRSRFAPLEQAELVCATDRNPARRVAAEAMGLDWRTTAGEIFSDPWIDAVFIASNNLSHAPLAAAALEAGKHVLVEKPLATTVAEAEALVRLAADRNLSLAADHMMVHNAWNRKAREWVASGRLGPVNDACFHMEFAYGYERAEAESWRCSSRTEMGGPIGDVASHCFYMAEFIFEREIRRISCVYLPKTLPIQVEDGAHIQYVMAGGLTGSVRVAFSAPRGGLGGTLSNLGYEIYGSEAVLRGYGTLFQLSGHEGEPFKIRLELDRFHSQELIEPDRSPGNIYRAVVEAHAESILKGQPLNALDALRNTRLCLAAHESARSGGAAVNLGPDWGKGTSNES
jgi:predicted dehydrogenase